MTSLRVWNWQSLIISFLFLALTLIIYYNKLSLANMLMNSNMTMFILLVYCRLYNGLAHLRGEAVCNRYLSSAKIGFTSIFQTVNEPMFYLYKTPNRKSGWNGHWFLVYVFEFGYFSRHMYFEIAYTSVKA